MNLRQQRPQPEKTFKNGNLRCHTMIKRGTHKPGVWKQCHKKIAENKNKYCEKHNSPYISTRS